MKKQKFGKKPWLDKRSIGNIDPIKEHIMKDFNLKVQHQELEDTFAATVNIQDRLGHHCLGEDDLLNFEDELNLAAFDFQMQQLADLSDRLSFIVSEIKKTMQKDS